MEHPLGQAWFPDHIFIFFGFSLDPLDFLSWKSLCSRHRIAWAQEWNFGSGPWGCHGWSTFFNPSHASVATEVAQEKNPDVSRQKVLKICTWIFFLCNLLSNFDHPPLPHDFFEPKFHSWAHAIWCRPNDFQLKKSRGSSENPTQKNEFP